MAKRTVYASDLTGRDIPDGEQVELRVLELDGLSQPVKLDASKTETDRLRVESSSLALLEIVMPDGETVRVAIPADQFKKAIRGDADEVLANAEGLGFVQQPEPEAPRRGRKPRGETAPRPEKTDYLAQENFGLIHRGKVTDEEAAMVRGNIEQANANRTRAGQAAINPDDEKDKRRYGL